VNRRPLPFLALGAAAAIAIAGCGSSDDGGSTASAASSGGGLYGGGSDTSTAKAAPSDGGGAATIATKRTNLGTILVDGQGRTLYLWVADKGDKSVCDGACAKAWPPVLTDGAPQAQGGVNGDWLGTTERDDGTTEVTYKGHPLYTFVQDKAPGDVTGQGSDGFGADWWVVDTDGNAVTTAV
jgi:predicted lipoprotein with Yx(FWY)xxD motif